MPGRQEIGRQEGGEAGELAGRLASRPKRIKERVGGGRECMKETQRIQVG